MTVAEVPIQTTTPKTTTAITSTMNPVTPAGPETTTWNYVTERTLATDNDNKTTAADNNSSMIFKCDLFGIYELKEHCIALFPLLQLPP